MTSQERLAQIHVELGRLGVQSLVMGGHATRFYGLHRDTVDFDMSVSAEGAAWTSLGDVLRKSPLFANAVEGTSWRPTEFRRFVIGRLADGGDELLEFWRTNHLLPKHDELFPRSVEGEYGGARIRFLGIDDLIRSKETERLSDWNDIAYLEGRADEIRFAAGDTVDLLRKMRSLKGFERAVSGGLLEGAAVREAIRSPAGAISAAYLLPAVPEASLSADLEERLGPAAALLRKATTGSARHKALVETVRRAHRDRCRDEDRADKERRRAQP